MTALPAAPITTGEEEHIAPVVLTRSNQNNRFYVHEVLTTKNGAPPFKTGALNKGDPSGDAPSVYSILDRIRAVKDGPNTEVRYSVDEAITEQEIRQVQSIGPKSVNDFTSADIRATSRFAQRYWQEMGIKSPFFRAWFGDWRAGDQTPVQVADQQGQIRGMQHNEDTGWDVQVSGKVFSETKNHAATSNRAARPYLPYINDMQRWLCEPVLPEPC